MTPETRIQINICETLSLLAGRFGFVFFAVPNEVFLREKRGKSFTSHEAAQMMTIKKMGLLPGVSDLVILSHGRAYCLEVKTPTGKQSEAQKLFEAACVRCGTPYAVVRSVDETIKKLKEWEVVKS